MKRVRTRKTHQEVYDEGYADGRDFMEDRLVEAQRTAVSANERSMRLKAFNRRIRMMAARVLAAHGKPAEMDVTLRALRSIVGADPERWSKD